MNRKIQIIFSTGTGMLLLAEILSFDKLLIKNLLLIVTLDTDAHRQKHQKYYFWFQALVA